MDKPQTPKPSKESKKRSSTAPSSEPVRKKADVPSSCNECGLVFTTHFEMSLHSSCHAVDTKKYKCPTCGSLFHSHQKLKDHPCLKKKMDPKAKHKEIQGQKTPKLVVKTSTESPRLKPTGKALTPKTPSKSPLSKFPIRGLFRKDVTLLDTSQRRQEHKKTYSCDFCKKQFLKHADLVEHGLTHTDVEAFECKKCQERFATKEKLDKHVKTHSPRGMFFCKRCGDKFAFYSYLEEHKESCHSKDDTIKESCHAKDDAVSSSKDDTIKESCHAKDDAVSSSKDKPVKKVGQHSDTKEHSKLKKTDNEQGHQSSVDPAEVKKHHSKLQIKEKTKVKSSTPAIDEVVSSMNVPEEDITMTEPMETEQTLPKDTKEPSEDKNKEPSEDKNKVEIQEVKSAEMDETVSLMDTDTKDQSLEDNEVPAKQSQMNYRCVYCEKGFGNKAALLEHESTHTMKRHSCETCNESFENDSQLVTHMATHKQPVPGNVSTLKESYDCPHCDKVFSRKSSLDGHVKTHKGPDEPDEPKPLSKQPTFRAETNYNPRRLPELFGCVICSKIFSQKDAHDAHLKEHFMIVNYTCCRCQQQFQQRDQLNKHLATHVAHVHTYNCSKCPLIFPTLTTLNAHFTDIHEMQKRPFQVSRKDLESSEVRKDFNSPRSSRHQTYRCTVCGEIFLLRINLDIHMQSHEAKNLF